MALLADPTSVASSTNWHRARARCGASPGGSGSRVGEVFADDERAVPGPHHRRDRRGRRPRDLRRAVRHRPRRRPAHRPVPAGDRRRRARPGRSASRCGATTARVVGGTDAGAHLDLLATFNATTAMLGRACRELKLLPFEEAISYITDAPAQLYGLKDRGRLAEGYHADVVVVDPTTVGRPADRDPPRPPGRLVAALRRGRRHRPRARQRHRDRRPRPAHRRSPGSGDALGP